MKMASTCNAICNDLTLTSETGQNIRRCMGRIALIRNT